MTRTRSTSFLLCVSNRGYAASLVVRRIYPVVADAEGSKHGLVRVVDESGEDYLFPKALFVPIRLPSSAVARLADSESESVPQRAVTARRK